MTCECGREVGVALRRGFVDRLAEQEELELGREQHGVAELGGGATCRWRMRRGETSTGSPVVFVEHVADHERGGVEPRDAANGREVGLHRDVSVALLPVGELVSRQRVHVDVDGEQVVAHVNGLAAALHLLGPVVAGHALADEPALEIGERDEHGVDRAVRDLLVQLRGREHPRHRCHGGIVGESYSGVT